MKFAIAKKLNMTQLFTEDGVRIPVTVLEVETAKVNLLRSKEKDGYEAVQLQAKKTAREFRVASEEAKPGQEVSAAVFEPGDMVNLKGTSKGRGFAGVMKRHGFHGFPASHGHPHMRRPGSIGQAFPQHVRKGMRMSGQMGAGSVTEIGLQVVAVDPEKNLLFVKGSVPGAFGGLITVLATGKKKDAPKLMEFGAEAEKMASETEQEQDKPEQKEEDTQKSEEKEAEPEDKPSQDKTPESKPEEPEAQPAVEPEKKQAEQPEDKSEQEDKKEA